MATSPPYQTPLVPPPIPPQIPSYYDPSSGIPPPPPPKPNSNNASRSGTPYNPSQFQPPPPAQAQLPPAGSPELFIPPVLQDKSHVVPIIYHSSKCKLTNNQLSRDDLLYILHSPPLLDALYLGHHPSSTHNLTLLNNALSANTAQASRLQSLNAAVEHQRAATSSSLLKTRALERTWRDKENEMDVALNRFSPRALHARLGQAVGEADAVSRALEESFLEDDGLGDADAEFASGGNGGGGSGGGAAGGGGGKGGMKASKDVDNFVKSYRGVRALYHLRKERKERWDENRVGGWR
ncbi:hypothetical protein ABW19_dt0208067 [Dactylella cylindrospora]|nr:hypothetical protein ABW19_dt0208067 [Dactylella cylindrospora]